jgi:Flp pilus assembly protein TadG
VRRLNDDRGAVAVITAIMLSLVLIAIAALAIDASALYAEKRELQNVADAAALAIAEDCVNRPVTCSATNAQKKAEDLAVANSSDGLATVVATLGTGKVTVVASTKNSGGTLMPSWFSGREDNGTVRTRAVVTWGNLGAYGGLAVTVSACEWAAATAGGYAPEGPYPPNPALSYQRILKLHTTSGVPVCGAGPSGADVPGGFGWLDHNSRCVADSSTGVFSGDPGTGLPSECKDPLAAAWASKQPIYLPIYNRVTGTGNNTEYLIAGYAAFVVTGYALPGGNAKSWLNNQNVCTGSDKCIAGFFTKALVSGPAGGGSYGVTTPPRLVE